MNDYKGFKSQALDFNIYSDGVSVSSVTQEYTLAPALNGQPRMEIKEGTAVIWSTDWKSSPPPYTEYPTRTDDTEITTAGKNFYWERQVTYYSDNDDPEYGTATKSTMLDVDFINALGITAKKITVLQNNTEAESTENRIIFEANGYTPKGIVKIGGFNVDDKSLSAGGVAANITEQYAVYGSSSDRTIYTDEEGLPKLDEYIDKNSRFYDPGKWPGLEDENNFMDTTDYDYLRTRPLIITNLNELKDGHPTKTLLCYETTESWKVLGETKDYDVWTRYDIDWKTGKWRADSATELYLTNTIVNTDTLNFIDISFVYLGTDEIGYTIANIPREELVFIAGTNFGITNSGNVYAQNINLEGNATITDCVINNQLAVGRSFLETSPIITSDDTTSTTGTVDFTIRLEYSYRGNGKAKYSITFTPPDTYKSATTQSLGTLNSIAIKPPSNFLDSSINLYFNLDMIWYENQSTISCAIEARDFGFGPAATVSLSSITFNNTKTDTTQKDNISIMNVSYLTGAPTKTYYLQTTSGIIPATDNKLLLGLSDQKWNEIHATNVYATTFYASSDKRLKENIKEYQPKKSVLDLPVVEFDFKDSKSHHIGCIAQDLQEICPEIVYTNKEGYLSIAENKLVYLLLLETKALATKVSYLESELNKLRKD